MDFYNRKGLHSPIPALFYKDRGQGQVNVSALQELAENALWTPSQGAALLHAGLGSCPGVPTEAGSGTGRRKGHDSLGMRSLRRVTAAHGRLEWTGAGTGMPAWLTAPHLCSSSMALWQLRRLFWGRRALMEASPWKPEPGLASRACDLGSCPGPRAWFNTLPSPFWNAGPCVFTSLLFAFLQLMLPVPPQAGCTLGFQEERTVVPLSVARLFGRPGAGRRELLGFVLAPGLVLCWGLERPPWPRLYQRRGGVSRKHQEMQMPGPAQPSNAGRASLPLLGVGSTSSFMGSARRASQVA